MADVYDLKTCGRILSDNSSVTLEEGMGLVIRLVNALDITINIDTLVTRGSDNFDRCRMCSSYHESTRYEGYTASSYWSDHYIGRHL